MFASLFFTYEILYTLALFALSRSAMNKLILLKLAIQQLCCGNYHSFVLITRYLPSSV